MAAFILIKLHGWLHCLTENTLWCNLMLK